MKKQKEIFIICFMGLDILARLPKGWPKSITEKMNKKRLKLVKEELEQALCSLYGVGRIISN